MTTTWKRFVRTSKRPDTSIRVNVVARPATVRRPVALVAAVAMAAAAVGMPVATTDAATQPAQCAVSTKLVPSCGVLMGVATHKVGTQTWDQSVTSHQQAIGRTLDVLHNYHQWNTAFPDSAETARAASGQKLLLTWIGIRGNGTVVKWASIAGGAEDSVIDAAAQRIAALGVPVWLNFQNEPESSIGASGTAAEYVAAWRHIHDRFASKGVTNAVWTPVFMGVTSDSKIAQFRALYPGDAYVDWIAWDPYNRGNPWNSFADTVRPFYDWLTANGYGTKPFMLAEYGVVEDPTNPTAKADWFTEAGLSLTDGEFPNLKAVSYFDHPDTVASGNFVIDSTPASLASYSTYGQVLLAASTTPVTTPGAPTAVTADAASSSATVSWAAPSNTGAGVITGYTVTASPGGKSVTVAGPLPATTAAIAELMPGTGYTFAVTATNSSGTGPASAASNAVQIGAPMATIPSPTAGGWQRNGTATLANGGLQLTDSLTKYSAGTAFWPTAITGATSFGISFDSFIDGGTNADGLAFGFGDVAAGAKATAKGQSGGGLGWAGIPGFAVALDTYLNGTDPSSNFVGLATGFNPSSIKDLVWRATSATTPPLRAPHHIAIVVSGGLLFVTIDAVQVLNSTVTLPTSTLIGFTGSDGNRTDRHAVANVLITAN